MTDTSSVPAATPAGRLSRALLALADGTVFEGRGFGADTPAVGEVCFNTAMTGYQEILSDPSYAGQIVCFTFPHIGIVGTNAEDIETINPAVRGVIVRADARHPSNWRSLEPLDRWLRRHGIAGIAGIDTRALASRIREKGMPHGAIGQGDAPSLIAQARDFGGLEGLDLAKDVTGRQTRHWSETPWAWGDGYGQARDGGFRVVVIDYGAKHNILRELAGLGAEVTVVPATATFDEVMAHKPHGVVLSNGPGDPAATGAYAVATIRALMEKEVPLFGICLGHQMLGLALGGRTKKMTQGHHGANHPVKDLETGKVEIVSMNHGFTVDAETLPQGVKQTHVSLFDGSNCGLAVEGRAVFGVQYHPEASPGPMDSHYLFERFADAARKRA
ncbi:MAG: glutamine-hydrolyzing carbamoyl-phosphate synthase small subunit [Alphaproteobacteria bacterium]|nr:glutamine-hydrolyzing carbamoyl-phosphate synthase small subunit [Alphaproteobacteria bacterium]MBV9694089.1 glutamine-hydrolyzing carbamoyl-phosphate synthase small subunit [Alphaproteobacteria bacterium]